MVGDRWTALVSSGRCCLRRTGKRGSTAPRRHQQRERPGRSDARRPPTRPGSGCPSVPRQPCGQDSGRRPGGADPASTGTCSASRSMKGTTKLTPTMPAVRAANKSSAGTTARCGMPPSPASRAPVSATAATSPTEAVAPIPACYIGTRQPTSRVNIVSMAGFRREPGPQGGSPYAGATTGKPSSVAAEASRRS